MKTIAQTIDSDLFTIREKHHINEVSENEKPTLDINITAGIFILYSVFSLFSLLIASVLYSIGMEDSVKPFVVAIMLSAAVGIITFILSYASAMTFEKI